MVIILKKCIIIFIVLIFTFTTCFGINYAFKEARAVNQIINHSRTLVIDAGHGGIDVGTVGIDGSFEKNINLSIANKLYEFTIISGNNALLIRDGDYLVYKDNDNKKRSDLYNRMDFVNSINNSVLISIHQNHFENEKEWGTQIWYSPNDEESKALANHILSITKDNLQKNNNRENKKSDSSYYLLYKAKSPSVMVECGFMSNREENTKLQDDNYQSQMAYSIMLGYNEFLIEEK